MKIQEQYETERLILKPTVEEDAEFMLRLLNTPKWLQFIGDRNVRTIEDARTYIKEKIRPQYERLGYSNYTILRKIDSCKIGVCGLYDREGLEGIDVGFALLPEHEKKGYAFESVKKLMHIAAYSFGLTNISAITNQDNTDSQKLLERLGLQVVGKVRVLEEEEEEEELLLYRVHL